MAYFVLDLSILNFSGDVLEYPKFKKIFNSLHTHCQWPEIVAIMHLENAIRNLSPDLLFGVLSVKEAIKRLDRKFWNEARYTMN